MRYTDNQKRDDMRELFANMPCDSLKIHINLIDLDTFQKELLTKRYVENLSDKEISRFYNYEYSTSYINKLINKALLLSYEAHKYLLYKLLNSAKQ